MAAEAGVDDVVLIAALGLHRRMTDAELRHCLGDRIFDAFAPYGALLQHDAEDPSGLVMLGQTDEGEDVEVNRRVAESDLLVYVNINLVAMDGGHKSTSTGLMSYRSVRHHHNVRTLQHSRSLMDRPNSELHSSAWRIGRLLGQQIKVFQIETTLNNDAFPSQMAFLQKREWEWGVKDRATFLAASRGIDALTPTAKRSLFHSVLAPQQMTSVQAGEVEAVHASTIAASSPPATRRCRGPKRRGHIRAPPCRPVQRQLDNEPDPGHVPEPGLLFQPLHRQAAGAPGRRNHRLPPDAVGLPPGAPSFLHRLFRRSPVGYDRPAPDRKTLRGTLCYRRVVPAPLPDELRLPRRPPVLHVVLGCPRPGVCRQHDNRRR